MQIKVFAGIPVPAFPYPYKYLIGVGFYFYIKSQIPPEEKPIPKLEYLLFLPALCYAGLRAYWYINIHGGFDEGIFKRVYDTGFFVYNEFVYLCFNLLLLYFAIRFLKRNASQIKGVNKARKNWDWLLKFSYVFVAVELLNLIYQVIVNIAGLQHHRTIYLMLLVLNSIYIYWVGAESLTKSSYLFNKFSLKGRRAAGAQVSDEISQKLQFYLETEEVYTNKNLKVSDLATLVGTTEKELSSHIHEVFGVSFSDYINQFRVEKVKKLLIDEEQKQYTLLAIAENAGFSSKSSFNAVFKRLTGLTPSQYKKQHET